MNRILSRFMKPNDTKIFIDGNNENKLSKDPDTVTLEDLHNEQVFWKIYQLGGDKANILHDRKTRIPSTKNVNKRVKSLRTLQTDDSILLNNDVITKVAFESGFWDNFLNKSTMYVLLVQVVNIFFLIAMSVSLSLASKPENPSLAISYKFLQVQLMVWGLLSIICIVTLTLMRYFQPFLQQIVCEGDSTVHETWKNIGTFMLLVRSLILVSHIVTYVSGVQHQLCTTNSDAKSGYYDSTFQLHLILSCIDGVETVVFATLSFPLPWAMIFCSLELLSQLLRYLSCGSILLHNGNSITFMMALAFLSLFAMYSIVCLNTSVIVLSSRNFYQNTLRLAASTAEKRRFLDLLCTEIRSPLQHVVGAVSRITDVLMLQSSDPNIQSMSHIITRQTQLINLLSDNLLYLTRVEEGRALLIRDSDHLGRQRINVKDLTMKLSRQHTVVDDHDKRTFVELSHKIMLMSSSSSPSSQMPDSDDRNDPHVDDGDMIILGDLTMLTILLRNILYFGMVMLDDKQDIEAMLAHASVLKHPHPLSHPSESLSPLRSEREDLLVPDSARSGYSENSEKSSRKQGQGLGPRESISRPLTLTITVVKTPAETGGEGGRSRVKGTSGTAKATSSSSTLLSKLCVSLSCPALDQHLADIAHMQTTSAMPTTETYPLPPKASMRDPRFDPDLDHEGEQDPQAFNDKDQVSNKSEKEMLFHERIASGRMSAVANKDDFSTIFMTCSALTSRAGGSFSVTRSKVEFSISCGGLIEEKVANVGVSASANANASATDALGMAIINSAENITASTNQLATTNVSSNLTTNHGIKDSRGKQPMSGIGASLAGVVIDHPPLSHNYPYDITKIRVCVVAESSDVASSIPGLLEMIGILSPNISFHRDMRISLNPHPRPDDGVVHDHHDDHDEVNGGFLHCDVVFVDTIFDSVRIKELGFPGRVVLFSGSVAYLDDENVSSCDFVVPIPFMKADADNLKSWMITPVIAAADEDDKRAVTANHRGSNGNYDDVDTSFEGRDRRTDNMTTASSPLSTWSAMAIQVITGVGNVAHRALRQGIDSISDEDKSAKGRSYSLGTKFNYVNTRVFFVSMFKNDVEKTFCKWRLLNPKGESLYHVYATDCANIITAITLLIGVVSYAVVMRQTTQTYENCRESYCYSSPWTYTHLIFTIIVFCRSFIHRRILRPLGIGLYAYWFVGSLLVISAFNTHLLDFYFYHSPTTWLWSPNYWTRNLPPSNVKITFIDFCSTKFGATNGLEVLHVLMSSFSIICAGWMFHIMWPLSIISTSIALTRSYAIIYQINAYVIMDPAVADIIVICYVLFALTNYIGQFYLEITLRNEFQSFRKTTFSHLFLELSLDAVQKNLRKPLQSILSAKQRFLRMVENIAVTQRIEFTPSLLGEFDTLNIGNLLLLELYHELGLIDDFKQHGQGLGLAGGRIALARSAQGQGLVGISIGMGVRGGNRNVMGRGNMIGGVLFLGSTGLEKEGEEGGYGHTQDIDMSSLSLYKNPIEPFLLIEELLKLAASFSCYRSDVTVKVYVYVDPRLALIRTNGKLVSSVIVNALAKAHKNIWQRLHANEYLRSYVQEISITVQPLPGAKPCSFFDTRLMLVEIVESNGFQITSSSSSLTKAGSQPWKPFTVGTNYNNAGYHHNRYNKSYPNNERSGQKQRRTPHTSTARNSLSLAVTEREKENGEGFGSQICREVVLNASSEAIYEIGTSKCGEGFSFFTQRFTLPYQLHTCSATAETFRRLKRSPGALFTERPIDAYVAAYENFHRQLAWRVTRIHDDSRLLSTTDDQKNKSAAATSTSKLSILIIEAETEPQPPSSHHDTSNSTAASTAVPVNSNKGIKTLFKKNSWHVRTCRSMGEWDERYLSCHCVLIDMHTIPFMQSRDNVGPSGTVNDLSVVSLLRVLGYKMIIAQIEKPSHKSSSNGPEGTLQRASSLGIETLEESKSSTVTSSNNHHPSNLNRQQAHASTAAATNTTTTATSNSFDFTFNDANSSRAGIHQLEQACNARAVEHIIWN